MTTRCSVRSVRCEVNPLLRSWPSSGRFGPSMYPAGSGHLRDPRDGVLRLWHRSAKVRRPRQALMLRAVPPQQMRRATASGLRASLSGARFRSRHLPLLGTFMITFGELTGRPISCCSNWWDETSSACSRALILRLVCRNASARSQLDLVRRPLFDSSLRTELLLLLSILGFTTRRQGDNLTRVRPARPSPAGE
jgi:hypothetical protein